MFSFFLLGEEFDFEYEEISTIINTFEESQDIREGFSSVMAEPQILDNYDDDDLEDKLISLRAKLSFHKLDTENRSLNLEDFESFHTELRHQPNAPQWLLDLVQLLPQCFSNNHTQLYSHTVGHFDTGFLLPVGFGTESCNEAFGAIHSLSMEGGEVTGRSIDLTHENIDTLSVINMAEKMLCFMSHQLPQE
jgi:hypothetical protein